MDGLYVVSTGDSVALSLNGKALAAGKRSHEYLYTFDNVAYEPGKLEAVSYRGGKEISRYAIETVGEPYKIKLTTIENPEGFKADGADLALVQIEVVDKQMRKIYADLLGVE